MTSHKHLITYVFLIIEFLFWITILFYNPLEIRTGILGFTAVFISFIYVCIHFNKQDIYKYLLLSFIFSVIADYFLTLTDIHQTLGTFFFMLAQVSYMLVIFIVSKHKKSTLIWWMISSVILIVSISIIIGSLELLIIFSVLYYTLLVINVIHSWIYHKNFILFTIALTLYLCADTLVGIHEGANFISYENFSILSFIKSIHFNFIWFFYLPTQVLFALSSTYQLERRI